MRVNTRLIILCIATVLQAGVIFLLGAFGDHYVKTKLRALGGEQIQRASITQLRQIEALIDELNLGSLEVGSKDWLIVQRLVEKSKMGRDGLIYLVDARTHLPICHPDFGEHPELAEKPIHGWKTLRERGVVLKLDDGDSLRKGHLEIDGEHLWLAGKSLGKGATAIVVQQSDGDLESMVNIAAFPVTKLMVGICVMVLFLATAASFFILWSAETRLTYVENELEDLKSRPVQSRAFMEDLSTKDEWDRTPSSDARVTQLS